MLAHKIGVGRQSVGVHPQIQPAKV